MGITLTPSVGTGVIPLANNDATAEDTSGESVPDGPATDTCERREDSTGRTELGSCDA